MDWLSQHRAVLDCFEKTITLRIPGIPEFTWKNQLEPTAQVMALISDVDLVQEFPDVFPEDFPSLPPEWGIEITLVPNTAPISIPPYRLAPVELEELKK